MNEATQPGSAERTDWDVEDDPRLPRVLLLGDSISMGSQVLGEQVAANILRLLETRLD